MIYRGHHWRLGRSGQNSWITFGEYGRVILGERRRQPRAAHCAHWRFWPPAANLLTITFQFLLKSQMIYRSGFCQLPNCRWVGIRPSRGIARANWVRRGLTQRKRPFSAFHLRYSLANATTSSIRDIQIFHESSSTIPSHFSLIRG